MYEAVFNSIDDTLREDAGCSSELDYVEQTSWVLFLKYLDDYETDRELAGKVDNKPYARLIDGDFRWTVWASPKTADGKLDHNEAKSGRDLLDFVNGSLFPYLEKFKSRTGNPDSLEYKIGEIFGEIRNRLQSGYALRDVIDKVDKLKFLSNEEKHELSGLYEDKIKNMGNAGRNGGEYYTPRPLIQSMVEIIKPQINEKVYDGAVGSAGFLCEAFAWMSEGGKSRGGKLDKGLTIAERKILQKKTFYGKEKKSLAYVIGTMNMILHGIDFPNITHTNTLEEDTANIQEKDRYNVVLANPPFGGKERKEIQKNFPIETSETAYLFLQHFIKMLKKDGRCAVVIKNTFLSNKDIANINLRKHLLEECNLFAILDVPNGTFVGTGAKTIVLFFEKGKPTKKIWYYQPDLDRNLGKTNPLNKKDLAEFLDFFKSKKSSENSWSVDIKKIDKENYDLSVKNPNRVEEIDERNPKEILKAMEEMDKEVSKSLKAIKELL